VKSLGVGDEVRVVSQAGLFQAVPVPGKAQMRGLAAGPVLGADRRDPAPPARGQVPDSLGRCRHVVDHHVIHGALGDPLPEQHHGGAVVALGEFCAAQRERVEDQAIDQVRPDAAQYQSFAFGLAFCLVDEHRETARVRCLHHALC
jgi:hypothetical protein